MLTIKNEFFYSCGHLFDYELSNGELLHESEWNGEYYETENGIYRPVYEHDSFFGTYYVIGFEH